MPRRERVGRPDGSPYSADPRRRYRELVADGKLGAPGSELARRYAAMGGRHPRRRPVDLPPELREVLLVHRELGPLLHEHEREVERLRDRADRLSRVARGLR